MIVEERNYRLVPGGVPRYLETWHQLGRAPQVRHLGEPLGLYTVEIGQLNTLVYLWQYTDLADRTTRRAALATDTEFARFRGQVRALLVGQDNRILTSASATTDRSPP